MNRIVRATMEHAAELATDMRAADAAEVMASSGQAPLEALEDGIRDSTVASAWLVDGRVAAIFGIVHAQDNLGVPWLLTGNIVDRHPIAFAKTSRLVIRALLEICPVLVNAVDCRYEQALRWARWAGFDLIGEPRPFGHEGRLFQAIGIRAPSKEAQHV